MTKRRLDCLLPGEQIDGCAIETGDQQLINRGPKRPFIMENRDSLAGDFIGHNSPPNILGNKQVPLLWHSEARFSKAGTSLQISTRGCSGRLPHPESQNQRDGTVWTQDDRAFESDATLS